MRRPILAALVLAFAGCFYPADRGRAVEARLDRLVADNQRLEQELANSRDRLADTLAKLDTALQTLDKAARRSDADIGVQLQKNLEDVAALRGQVETYQHRVTELESALKGATEDLTGPFLKEALEGFGIEKVAYDLPEMEEHLHSKFGIQIYVQKKPICWCSKSLKHHAISYCYLM